MRFPVFSIGAETAESLHPNPQDAYDAALLYHAIKVAIEGALRFGLDFPVGAVTATGGFVTGSYYASDNRTGMSSAHAEYMAVASAKVDRTNPPVRTVAVTLEPCDQCQDFLASELSIKRIVFGVSREDASSKGLVKPHFSTIFDRLGDSGLEIVQVADSQLQEMGHLLLDSTTRDTSSGETKVDTAKLLQGLQAI